MFFSFIILTAFVFVSYQTRVQSFENFTNFSEFTQEEVDIKEVPFDKNGNAVIIHHLARSECNHNHNLVTEHRIKITILSDKEINNGDIHITFYHKDDFEFLSVIDAVIRT